MDMKLEGKQGDSYMKMDMNKNDVMASYKDPESYMDMNASFISLLPLNISSYRTKKKIA